MFGFVSKRKIIRIMERLNDSQDSGQASDLNDFYWRCGNANAINYICEKLGLSNPFDPNVSPDARMDGGEGHEAG